MYLYNNIVVKKDEIILREQVENPLLKLSINRQLYTIPINTPSINNTTHYNLPL